MKEQVEFQLVKAVAQIGARENCYFFVFQIKLNLNTDTVAVVALVEFTSVMVKWE